MTTDAERREVAERLRAGVGRGMPLILNVAFAAFEVDPVSLGRTVTSDEAAMRLADLIDPTAHERTVADNLALIERNRELECELARLKAELGRTREISHAIDVRSK